LASLPPLSRPSSPADMAGGAGGLYIKQGLAARGARRPAARRQRLKADRARASGVKRPGLPEAIASVLCVVAISHVLVGLFGRDIPAVMASFFKGAEEIVMLGVIFVFVLAWMRRIQPRRRSGPYAIVAFDVFGRETAVEGIRTSFRSRDVALSFAKQYRRMHPLHNFAVLTDVGEARRTIIRYV